MVSRYTLYIDLRTLHSLVWSMTQPEQVTYAAIVVRKGDAQPAYDKFYALLRQHAAYDEQAIIAHAMQLGLHKSSNLFTKLRHYLYHVILRALQAASDAQQGDIANLIQQARILIFKGFHHLVPPILKAAWDLAHQIEDFPALIQILEMRIWHLQHTHPAEVIPGLHLQLRQQQEQVFEQMHNLFRWRQLADHRLEIRSAPVHSKHIPLLKVTQDPLFASNDAKSKKAQFLRLVILKEVNAKGDVLAEEMRKGRLAMLSFCKEYPDLLTDFEMAEHCLWTAGNLALVAHRLGNKNDIQIAWDALGLLTKVNPEMEAQVRQHKLFEGLYASLISLSPDDASEATKAALAFLRDPAANCSLYDRYRMVTHGMYVNLLQGKEYMAIRFANLLRNDPPSAEYARWHILVTLLFLAAQWAKGEWDILLAEARHAQRHLSAAAPLSAFPQAWLRLMHEIARKPEQQQALLAAAQPHLTEALAQDRFFDQMFDFDSFVEAQATGKSFLHLHRRNRKY